MADRDTFGRRLTRFVLGAKGEAEMRERRTSRRTRGSPDRVILTTEILPIFAKRGGRILWVGCRRYTDDYPALLEAHGAECWTTDIDPEAAPFGRPGRHRTGDLTQIDAFFSGQRFDTILCNGVIGHGVDAPEAQRGAMQAMAALMNSGGLLLVGWNTDKMTAADLAAAASGLFTPTALPAVPAHREVPGTTHVYDLFARD
ncbi:hypothetical protein BH09PSE2_BH09PSE2_03870 [soil metagenome]